MPVRIPEVCLAEPAVTPFAVLGGMNHTRPIPEMPWQNIVRRSLSSFPHGDASPLPLFIEASRGTCRTSSVCGDAPENDLIEGDVGACLSNPSSFSILPITNSLSSWDSAIQP